MKRAKYLIALLLILCAVIFQEPWFWFMSPQKSYEFITGNKLPKGAEAKLFGSMFNDNFFHKGYYWEFRHSKTGLKLLKRQLNIGENYELYEKGADLKQYDAIWRIQGFEEVFRKEIPMSSVERGYEFNGNQNKRDDWLLIIRDGEVSYLELN